MSGVVMVVLDRFRRRPLSAPAAGERLDVAPDPHLQVVAERLATVEAELTAAVGSVSMCVLARRGEPHPAAKYWEGGLAALMELRRRLADGSGDDVRCAELDRIAAVWREQLADAGARSFGPDWLAYRAGGIDELERLGELLGCRDRARC